MMEFQASNTQDALEVRLAGRLEFTDHDRLIEITEMLERQGLRRFTMDMSGLEFIDSAGLGMLLILQEESEQRNIRMVVRGPQGDVRRSIDLAKIGEIINVQY